MNKHTPGPWSYGRHINGYRLIDADNWTSLALVIEFDEDDNTDPEGIANARLIAAAPDLLEALEMCVSVKHLDDSEILQIKQLLAKAKGEV